jgi:hypothetical protein
MDDERRSRVTPPCSRSSVASASRRRLRVTEIDHFSFRSANGSRRDASRPLNRTNAGKHRLCCNLGKRGVEFIADLALASDEHQAFRVMAARSGSSHHATALAPELPSLSCSADLACSAGACRASAEA